jgi:hypothetical protein
LGKSFLIPRNLPAYIPIKKKEEAVVCVAEENIRCCLGGTEGMSGGYPERRKIESIFKKVAASRCRFFNKRRSDANLYRQKLGGELLEKNIQFKEFHCNTFQNKKNSNIRTVNDKK